MSDDEITFNRARSKSRGIDMLFDDIMSSEKPSLGDPSVVEGLVRQFGQEVAEIRANYNAGTIAAAVASSSVVALGKRYGDIFAGRNDAYQALPWNTDGGLAAAIHKRWYLEVGPDMTGHFFIRLASLELELMAEHETGQISDDIAQFRVEAMTETAFDTLMGYPEQTDN